MFKLSKSALSLIPVQPIAQTHVSDLTQCCCLFLTDAGDGEKIYEQINAQVTHCQHVAKSKDELLVTTGCGAYRLCMSC